MQHVSSFPSADSLHLFGTIRWSALQEEVKRLQSISTSEKVTLDNICEFLQNVSQAQWNTMADVNVEVRIGRQMRSIRWTKHLFRAIVEAANGNLTLDNLLKIVESYKQASRQHITRITTFTQVDQGAFRELLESVPSVNGCLEVDCLIQSLAKIPRRDLKALAQEEDEHGYGLEEIKLSLEAMKVRLLRLVTESKKGERRSHGAMVEDQADIFHRVERIKEIVRSVMEDDWADIWNANARHLGLPPEALIKTGSPTPQASLSHSRLAFSPVNRRSLADPSGECRFGLMCE